MEQLIKESPEVSGRGKLVAVEWGKSARKVVT